MSLLPYFIDSLNIDIHEKIIETSSDTFSIIIGQTTLIPGFLKAVKQMKNKEISTAVVPYYYGYGSNAQFIMQDSVLRVYQLLIPHYSTLIYKLQIDSVRK
jgi:FKBP-type peptidyl-prolyl cis-trans isomerase 2